MPTLAAYRFSDQALAMVTIDTSSAGGYELGGDFVRQFRVQPIIMTQGFTANDGKSWPSLLLAFS